MPLKPDVLDGGPARSLGDLQGRLLLKNAIRRPELPSIETPSMEGLRVPVPRPPPVTSEEVLERFEALCHERAPRRERQLGEEVAEGDDVLLDVLGYAQGRLIPFSARGDWRVRVTPDDHLPGFFEALVGAQAGLSACVELVLPDTYPVEALRGVTASFIVDVKAVHEVLPLEPDAPDLLTHLAVGETTEEALRNIAEQLALEHEQTAHQEFQTSVLDALVERTRVELPEALVDEELRRRWAEAELPLLATKNFDAQELAEAWEGWRTDAATRVDAQWRLRGALALQAIAERDGVQPRPELIDSLCASLEATTEVSREELARLLEEGGTTAERFTSLAMHHAALEHVMERVMQLAPLDAPSEPNPG